MKRSSRNSSENSAVSSQQSARPVKGKRRAGTISTIWLVAGCWLLMTGTGCESLQKKFTRRPKTPLARPSPIITFEDYTRQITPLDRYRKHYAMYEYWNAELLDALRVAASANPKQLKRASTETLQELKTLQGLLQENLAAQMDRVIQDRTRVDQQLQRESVHPAQLDAIRREVEAQTRQMNREFFWRKVEDRIKETQTGSADASPD